MITATPQKRDDAIARKLAMVREDVETMRNKLDFLGVRGGPHPLFTRVEFHVRRAELLEWMTVASAEEINRRRLAAELALGDAVTLKGSSMTGLPAEIVDQIAHLELLELGLGLHACQQG